MVFNKCDLLNTFSVARSKVFLFALLATLSLVISSLSPLVANAASIYDGFYTHTDKIELEQNGFGSTCAPQDLSLSWAGIINNEDNWGTGYDFAAAKTSFNNAIENGRWGVSQSRYQSGANYQNTIWVYWTENTDLALTWNVTGGGGDNYVGITSPSGNVKALQIYLNNSCQAKAQYYTTDQGALPNVSNKDYTSGTFTFSYINYFVYTDHPNYPADYEGDGIIDGGGTSDVAVRPDFKYNILDKNLKVKDYGQDLPTIIPDEGYTFKGWDVEWSLFYCEGGWEESGSSCKTELKQVAYDILPVETDFVTDVDVYGDYRLFAEYQAQQCYRYPSYPATPDYCFYVGGESETSLDGYYFPPTSVKLVFDGGTYSGDTKETECDEAGYCVPPSPYEDCSPYGGVAPYGFGGGAFPDLIGGFACQLRNFGTFLVITFQSLFIPNAGKVQKTMDGFTTFFQGKLGFVYTAFSFIIQWLGSILIITPSCNLNAFSGTFFGATPQVNVCQMEQSVPTIWNIGITFTRLLFAAALVFIAYRRMLNILTGLGK